MSARPFSTSLRLSLFASLGLLPLACGVGDQPFVPTCTESFTDPTTGVVTCKEGYVHRTLPNRCVTVGNGAAAPVPETKPRVTDYVDCTDDPSVCDQFLYGYCAPAGQPQPGSACATGCLSDSDCGTNGMCRCEGGQYGVCTGDTCDSDSDCTPGYLCASYPGSCGNAPFACQTPKDDCASCEAYELCEVQEDGHRACASAAACGRPFLVEAKARVAPITARSDWSGAPSAPRVDHLTSAERSALGAHWTKLGQMEHASIAAFARFQLQLLALGAPPELVQACNQALLDETAHTRLCFGLASAYAGRDIGPGGLDVSHSLDVSSLTDIVELVLVEGCFGETSAALDALEAAQTAADPVIRRAYEQIAADEQRHAELAFHFVRWALERDRDAVTPRVLAALERAPGAVAEVAVPCLRALLQRPLAA